MKHEDTYWPIQYLRGKKNYGKIFFQEYMHEPNSSLAYLYMGPNPALGYLWQLCILQTYSSCEIGVWHMATFSPRGDTASVSIKQLISMQWNSLEGKEH